MLGQHLDGDGAVEAGVGGFVDLAHAPGAEGGVDLVGAEGCSRCERHHRLGYVTMDVQRQLLWPLGDNYFGRFRCDLDRCREYGDGLTSLWTARAPSTGS